MRHTTSTAFYDGLVEHGLIVPVACRARSAAAPSSRTCSSASTALVTRLAKDDGAEVYTFPPVIDRDDHRDAPTTSTRSRTSRARCSASSARTRRRKALSARVHAGEPWGDDAGHHRRAAQPGRLLPGLSESSPARCRRTAALVTMTNWVYRHEPSPEPTRMQSFRVREFVRVGTPDMVVAWRDQWLAARPRAARRRSGCRPSRTSPPIRSSAAAARCSPTARSEQKLKFEVLVPVISHEQADRVLLVQLPPGPLRRTSSASAPPTARSRTRRASASASSACVMALFKTHGFDPQELAGAGPRASVAVNRVVVLPHLDRQRLPAPRAARRRSRLGREELLRRHLDRGHPRARAASRWRCCRSSSRSTSRATSGRSSSRRTTSCATSTASTSRS